MNKIRKTLTREAVQSGLDAATYGLLDGLSAEDWQQVAEYARLIEALANGLCKPSETGSITVDFDADSAQQIFDELTGG